MKSGQPVSHNDASVLLRAIQRKTGKSLTMRAVPKPKYVSRRQLDREQAMRMMEGEMVASLQRCAELEKTTKI